MSGKKYVPEGVYLVCDKGAKPSELRSLSSKKTTIFGENMCTKVDTKIAVNFDPFGACSCSNGNPCTAPVTGWTNVSDAITLGGNELLLENSELPCALGGKVKIFFTMAAATAAMPKPKKSFWRKAVDTIAEINQTIVDFEVGVAKGLWKGLKGTVTGVVDLVIWAGKHHPIYMLANPQGYAEQLKKDKETFKAIGNALGKASKWMYRNSMANMLTNPNDYRLAQQENAIMLDKMMEKAATMNAEDWGSFLGQVLFEVGLEVATVGGAAALTAVKAADKTLDAVKVINALDNASDAAKVLDKAEDIADGAKVLDKINDGNKIDLPKIEPKVLEDVTFKVDDLKNVSSKQKKLINDIENGKIEFEGYDGHKKGNHTRKSNYGEMKMDQHMKDLGYEPLHKQIDSIDQPITKGIDGVYKNPGPPPKYVIGEAKYDTSKLSQKAKDGAQMSDEWIEGSKRLEKAVGDVDLADEILLNGYDKVVFNTNKVGEVTAKVVETTTKVNKAGKTVKITKLGAGWP
ncbi:PAAR-like protein [Aquimarina algiphila]|uniref:PAAR-like protein n=1 Tax=Aquimarina algiphila TaxID=2047982 RepID=UPI00232F6E7C|nr:PAAR-like protein [Aquimarina algiphila]